MLWLFAEKTIHSHSKKIASSLLSKTFDNFVRKLQMSSLTSFLPQQNRLRKLLLYFTHEFIISHFASSASMDEEFVIDHRKLKERMSSIVRSKEGCVKLNGLSLSWVLPF